MINIRKVDVLYNQQESKTSKMVRRAIYNEIMTMTMNDNENDNDNDNDNDSENDNENSLFGHQ